MQANSILPYKNPSTSAFIERYQEENQTKVTLLWKTLPHISNALKRAVLVSEDDGFFAHEGVDFKELKNSWETDWKKKKIVRGGSTLSMQLVKNLYLSPSKNPVRKINEILLTLDLERKVSKPRILELYLNLVEWGPGIFGAESASQHYFKKSSEQLTEREAAYLAAILPNPAYLSGKGAQRATFRQNVILKRMPSVELPVSLSLNP